MDSSYRDIIPYLRPRPGEIDALTLITGAFLLALAALVIGLHFRRAARQRRRLWRVYARSANALGLSASQTKLLGRIARRRRIRNPLMLLNSVRAFDKAVGEYVLRTARHRPKRARHLASEIARIRRNLGFDRGAVIRSTRQLDPGMAVVIRHSEVEEPAEREYRVVAQEEVGITLRPTSRTRSSEQLRPGDEVEVDLRHSRHVRYHFGTQVLKSLDGNGIVIAHTPEVTMVQNRQHLRLRTQFDVTLYRLPKEAHTPPDVDAVDFAAFCPLTGTVCDISGGGMSVTVPGEPAEDDCWWIVDPRWEGPFPIAGVVGEELGRQRRGARTSLHLRFVDLPMRRQDDLVGHIMRSQLRAAS